MKKEIIIIGGGLAGLITAIHLAKFDVSVTLIEKDTYPRHKVCGEYISNEILPYLEYLNIDIGSLNPVLISNLLVTTVDGATIQHTLPLGGFGISRYALDFYLWQRAKAMGVQLLTDQVISVKKQENHFVVKTTSKELSSNLVIGAYGKRSTLDKKLKRDFDQKKSSWLAVKAHYQADFDSRLVALHNFEGGYCGLSKIENNLVNACYLVNYKSFKRFKNINDFQEEILCKNPFLNDFFRHAIPQFSQPITISQINFKKKKPVENGIFMTGDAAGLIHPLCGNGMAMAIRGGKILSELIIQQQAENTMSRAVMEQTYHKAWNNEFSKRLYVGRVLQRVLLNKNIQQIAQKATNVFPAILPYIIKQTHGKPLIC